MCLIHGLHQCRIGTVLAFPETVAAAILGSFGRAARSVMRPPSDAKRREYEPPFDVEARTRAAPDPHRRAVAGPARTGGGKPASDGGSDAAERLQGRARDRKRAALIDRRLRQRIARKDGQESNQAACGPPSASFRGKCRRARRSGKARDQLERQRCGPASTSRTCRPETRHQCEPDISFDASARLWLT